MRLLMARRFPCPHCAAPAPAAHAWLISPSTNPKEPARPAPGLGTVHQADLKRLVDEQQEHIRLARWLAGRASTSSTTSPSCRLLLPTTVLISTSRWRSRTILSRSATCSSTAWKAPCLRRHFPAIEPPATVRRGRFEGVATNLLRRYAEHIHAHIHEAGYRDKLEDFLVTQPCPDCDGTRLRPESRLVTVNGQTIIALSGLPLADLGDWLEALPAALSPDEALIAGPVLENLNERIARLVEVGAGYLTLERASLSLSAGEAQRLRLASLLGSGLSGVLYVFDEPTIGLHHRDTRRLIEVLRRLRDLGNTVLVIEHDLEMILSADYVVDFGPGGGNTRRAGGGCWHSG